MPAAILGAFLLISGGGCQSTQPAASTTPAATTLRMGVAEIEVQQVVRNLSLEGLVKVSEQGKVTAGLATAWSTAPDGLSMVVELRPNVRFHDGSAASAAVVAESLRRSLPAFMGKAYEDVTGIQPISDRQIRFSLKQPSSFLIESLESQIEKPDAPGVGTGPFIPDRVNEAQLQANPDYFLGPSAIQRIVVQKYPTLRAAWAELLRNQLDMLYEVGGDALVSLRSATNVNVFSFVRRYQYVVLLNSQREALRSPVVRRAFNFAIDREALVRDALNGHGLAAEGPVWPRNWAAQGEFPKAAFDPERAAKTLAHTVTFKCLVAAEDEVLALVVKRQLEAVGVEMIVEIASIERVNAARTSHDFDAILGPAISGPTMFRPYMRWHSQGALNRGVYASPAVDRALDAIRHSVTDAAYRTGVLQFQQAILDDPPAIFLAWDERARAVSNRFDVQGAEQGADILGTLRLWKPDNANAGRVH